MNIRLPLFALFALTGCVAFVPFIEPVREPPKQGPRYSYVSPPQKVAAQRKQPTRIQKLLRDMESPKDVVRAHAAFWLGEMYQEAVPAVPVLVANAEHPNEWVRRASVKALGKIGDDRAIPTLCAALKDPNRFIGDSAGNALNRFSGGEKLCKSQ